MEVIDMSKSGYGIVGFLIDLLLTSLTGGLWLLFILLRYLRKRA
jgi:cell shape-determining protein MreD